jgi:hypothetical protein
MEKENPTESVVLKAGINQERHEGHANDDSAFKHDNPSLWQDEGGEVSWGNLEHN